MFQALVVNEKFRSKVSLPLEITVTNIFSMFQSLEFIVFFFYELTFESFFFNNLNLI